MNKIGLPFSMIAMIAVVTAVEATISLSYARDECAIDPESVACEMQGDRAEAHKGSRLSAVIDADETTPLKCSVVRETRKTPSFETGKRDIRYDVLPIQCVVTADTVIIRTAEINRGNCPLATEAEKNFQNLLHISPDPNLGLFNQKLGFGETFYLPGSAACRNPIEWTITISDGKTFRWRRY